MNRHDDKAHWPWLSGRHAIVQLMAEIDHDLQSRPQGPLLWLVPDLRVQPRQPTWRQILDALDRQLKEAGKAIAEARTGADVDGARLRWREYSEAMERSHDALLGVAHRLLQEQVLQPQLVGYGKRKVNGPLELIEPADWEAGTPDWKSYRLVVDGTVKYHGIRILYLAELGESTVEAVLADLGGKLAEPQKTRGGFSNAALEAWYRERVENWPDPNAWPSSNDDWEAARGKFGQSISRAAIRKVRAELAPAEWQRRARPKGGRKNSPI